MTACKQEQRLVFEKVVPPVPAAVLLLCAGFLKHPPLPYLLRHTNGDVSGVWVKPRFAQRWCWAEQGGQGFPDEEHP